jgi:sugar lactone lactonase YvrE
VYIADYSNNVIRKITAADGKITTIAGTGTAGYTGDGGLATSATLSSPSDVTVDGSGNVYIVEAENQVIRKITASDGKINTIAGTGTAGYTGDGGLATAATLNYPYSVSLDAAGNLYIADAGNYVIRKITALDGKISTIAGTGGSSGDSGDGGLATSAKFIGVQDAVVDSAGNVYVSDYNAHRIRKITASDGKISTIAGTGAAGFSGDEGPADAAQINYPGYIDLDAAGNLYIAEYGNNRVRKVASGTGIITTIAGTGTRAYTGDGGPALSADIGGPWGLDVRGSTLYISDYNSHAIRTVVLATAPVLPPTGSNTTELVWLATALFTAGAVLVATRRRVAL